MSKVRHRDDQTAVLYVRVPGWLKEQVVEHCEQLGVSVSSWVANLARLGVLQGQGIPEPPRADQGVPSPQMVLEGIVTGLGTIEPCGRPTPCERDEVGSDWLDGMEFCRHCHIRVQ